MTATNIKAYFCKKPNIATAVAVPSFLSVEGVGDKIRSIVNSSNLSDESLIKFTRQLEYWDTQGKLSSDDFVELAELLAAAGSRTSSDASFQVPKVRYGRTEIQMPIITCGTMRCQVTWFPDNVPVLSFGSKKVLSSPSQRSLVEVIRKCLKMGINHFETARMYGTSEMQVVDALCGMIESGEIKRSDFIIQTKVVPSETGKAFAKTWEASWKHMQRLEYVDLFAFHAVSNEWQADWVLSDDDDMPMAFMKDLKAKGIIRHIGFSTHGPANNIMRLISSNKFDFVNIHAHYFGDYHAEGTPINDGLEHGNSACVRKALELDMGVFLISPYDKGGKLYKPTKTVASAVGHKLTPISFASLYCWKKAGIHTFSVGLARMSDLDETLEAARLYSMEGIDDEVDAADKRLKAVYEEKLGSEWMEKGMLNLPSYYCEETNGTALGHTLWCHNIVKAYGMYEFAKDRYGNLEDTRASWSEKKSFEDNAKAMNFGNPGLSFDPDQDLTAALSKHYNSELVKEKLAECHDTLKKENADKVADKASAELAYDLTTWEDYPGVTISLSKVMLQVFTRGLAGIKGNGPTVGFTQYAASLRGHYAK